MTNLARLKRRLKRRGFTQDQLAQIAAAMSGKKCSRTYINHFFAGRRSPAWLRVVLESLVDEPQQKAS